MQSRHRPEKKLQNTQQRQMQKKPIVEAEKTPTEPVGTKIAVCEPRAENVVARDIPVEDCEVSADLNQGVDEAIKTIRGRKRNVTKAMIEQYGETPGCKGCE